MPSTLALTSAAAWACSSGEAKERPSIRSNQYTRFSMGTPFFSNSFHWRISEL